MKNKNSCKSCLSRPAEFISASHCYNSKALKQIQGDVPGFTLIELLVVMLIIGILASIAIPQYQKAVWKSRAATLMTYAKAVGEAQGRYFLATGEYTDNLDDLDIDMQKVSTIASNCGVYAVGWGAAPAAATGFCVNDYACICFNQHTATHRAELAYFKKGPYKNAGFVWNHSMIGLTKGTLYCKGTQFEGYGPSGGEFCKNLFGLTTTKSDYWGKPYYPMNK